MSEFYTYLWLREDGTPYYAGKGSDDRAFSEHRFAGRAPSRKRILVQPHPSEKDAFAAEIFLIDYYGRKDIGTGILCNMTDGGEGFSGIRRTKESYAKAGAKMRGALNPNFGKTMSQEQRDLISDSRKGKSTGKRPKELCDKISATRKAKIAAGLIKVNPPDRTGSVASAESNRKRSVTLTGKYVGELASMFGRKHTEEWKEQRRAENIAAGIKPPSWKGKHHSPETIAKMRAIKLALHAAKVEALHV